MKHGPPPQLAPEGTLYHVNGTQLQTVVPAKFLANGDTLTLTPELVRLGNNSAFRAGMPIDVPGGLTIESGTSLLLISGSTISFVGLFSFPFLSPLPGQGEGEGEGRSCTRTPPHPCPLLRHCVGAARFALPPRWGEGNASYTKTEWPCQFWERLDSQNRRLRERYDRVLRRGSPKNFNHHQEEFSHK
jgi:hypothetical protein